MNHSICPYLASQFRLHPSMTPQDIAKLCYQAAYGAEHLLADLDAARRYLAREMDATPMDERIPSVEPISSGIARVNLASWKAKGRSADALFDLFAATASVRNGGSEMLDQYLDEVTEWLAMANCNVSPEQWRAFLQEYRKNGCPPVHHSQAYRDAERPAYRIVRMELLVKGGFLDNEQTAQ